ncbi:MAG TPA: hypothetical protein P5114_06890 [Hyphomicrobiaceae bacterium]|nr:hypothetical protein [Hyphomicrobiaceae bacterium]
MSDAPGSLVSNESSISGPTLRWVLRRAALGIVILMVTVTAAAYLFYAGIEPDRAEASSEMAHQVSQQMLTGSVPATGH